MTRLLTILLLLSAVTASGATVVANSTSAADVATAYGQCNPGDTLSIPAGSSTWASGTTITVSTPNVWIIGAGTNNTILTSTTTGGSGFFFVLNAPGGRVSGIQFRKPLSTGTDSFALAANAVATGSRFDHLLLLFGRRMIRLNGYGNGVIDHCTFYNCDIAIYAQGDDNAAWLRPINAGTTNFWYRENNWFLQNAANNEQGYHQEGTSQCWRFNLFQSLGAGHVDPFEAHGNQDCLTTSSAFRGTYWTEYYGNTNYLTDTDRAVYLRAGGGIICSNICVSTNGHGAMVVVTEEEGWSAFGGALNPPNSCITGSFTWPAKDQITNLFVWANTFNGAAVTDVGLNKPATDATYIIQGRDYFMAPPDNSNGNPAGSLASWTALSYPHPLVQAQDFPAPDTPTNISPTNNAVNVVVNPTLVASAYSSSGSPQQASEWQILRNTYDIWDSVQGAVTQVTYPGKLVSGVPYNWSVRYQAANGTWSSWSTPTAFTTVSPAAIPIQVIINNATIYKGTITPP